MEQQTYGEWMRSNPPIPNITAVEWLIEQLYKNGSGIPAAYSLFFEQAKQMEKEQMIEFAEFVASFPDKNKNYVGEMLHAKSKYDSSERTVDLLEIYQKQSN